MAEDSSRTCGRRSQLIFLLTLDLGVCAAIYYATTIQYATFHVSIGKATLTLNQTYKIVGISGGPIAGTINEYRNKLWRAHQAAYYAFPFISAVIYTLTQVVEYHRRKKTDDPKFYRDSCFGQFSRFLYFLSYLYVSAICLIGVVIWGSSSMGKSIGPVSFDVHDGAKVTAIAWGVLTFAGVWRLIAMNLRPGRTGKSSAATQIYNV